MYISVGTWILLFIYSTNFSLQAEELKPALLHRQKRMWVLGNIDIVEEDEGPFPKVAVKIHNDKTATQKIRFRLSGNGTENGLFFLKSDVIMVSRKIDREKTPVFAVNVHALSANTDKEVDQTLKYLVKVKDINDNAPVFNQSAYKVEIPENTIEGKEFFRVTATDADEINQPNSLISYWLIAQKSSKYFHIDASTGAISLTGCLNYEEKKSYNLIVKARDNGNVILSSTATVQVNVVDANNNLPVFKRTSNFIGKVNENDEHVIILRVSVTDNDVPQTLAWRAKYKIREGNENGNYKIETDPETNDGILSLVKHLDYESGPRRQLNITVENEEPFLICSKMTNEQRTTPDSISVVIIVENTNDPPVIHPPEVTVKLIEGHKPDSDLVKFNATDSDKFNPNKIRFIEAYDPEDWVNINEETGVVTAKHKMDRESPYVNESIYRVVVHAVDDAIPPLTGTATLNILLIDINDNKPYLISANEKMCDDGDTQYVTLKAKDDDMFPFEGPFKFALLDNELNLKDKWEFSPTIGYSVKLVRKKFVPIGNYTIPLIIQDRQGLVQKNTLHLWICPCPDGGTCPDPKSPTAVLCAAAIGLLFGALLILFLGLCLTVFLKKKSFFSLPAEDNTGSIVNYDQEGPSMALKDVSNNLLIFEESILNNNGSEINEGIMDISCVPTDSPLLLDWAGGGMSNKDKAEGMKSTVSGTLINFDNSRVWADRHNSDNLTTLMEFVEDYLNQKLNTYNGMENAHEHDQVHVYEYEGEESRRGSFDSITIVGCDSEYSFLDNLEINFSTLAKICQQKGQN